MLPETPAHIFLSDQRLALQNPFSHNFQTFLPGGELQGIGALQGLSDDRLRPGISLLIEAEADGTVIIIPWIGNVVLSVSSEKRLLLEEGQVHILPVAKGDFYEVRNPYSEEAVNFFQLRFTGNFSKVGEVFPIVLDKHRNRLLPIYKNPHRLLIGSFDARKEGVYVPNNPNHKLFIFAIEGAFEVLSRLIQPRDGLALWQVGEVEFEALSEGAVLLIVEIGD